MIKYSEIDYKNPDYSSIYEKRIKFLKKINDDPSLVPRLLKFYKENPVQFINDWGCTIDPRNTSNDRPAIIPFILFPKQEEFIVWANDLAKNNKSGLCEKSREMGVTWLAVALAVLWCVTRNNMVVGFGSRKSEEVDTLDNTGTIFPKIREFIKLLPVEFRAGYVEKLHSKCRHLRFPDTGSEIIGQSGVNIGRGSRYSVFFLDESAFLPHPKTTDRALSESTKCRIDISTPNPSGTANPFYEKSIDPKRSKIRMHWRDDPRKDEEWYKSRCEAIGDPSIIACELDISYIDASRRSILEMAWVQSAIDAHIKLGIEPTGEKIIALDPADEGKDKNAICLKYGFLCENVFQWSGYGSDLMQTTQRTYEEAELFQAKTVIYDADGLGAAVRGDAKIIEQRYNKKINFIPYRGSGKVTAENANDSGVAKNKDYFSNAKAQSWWNLRKRFYYTHRVITNRESFKEIDENQLVSISSKIKELSSLTIELVQPTLGFSEVGKMVIDKTPEGARSPNLADAFMMAFCGNTSRFIAIPMIKKRTR
jgi:hypothetical protein